MTKRRMNDSDDRFLDSGDNPIGLTSAFAPVKGPQSVDYDTEDDPVGLTQAFGAIPDQDEPRVWDEEGKWEGFDWDAGYEGRDAESAASEGAEAEPSSAADVEAAPVAEVSSGRGRHAAPEKQMSARMQKSRRTRKVLIILIILLILLAGLVGFFGYKTYSGAQHGADEKAQQQTQAQTQTQDVIETDTSKSSAETTTAKNSVPDLVSLFGKTSDEAIAAIGHGALVTANRPVDDSSSAIKTNLNVALTEEPADSKTGTPTVYLGLDKDGKVIQVGYSASASALGFGSLSFADAIGTEHVIEKTLAKIGVDVPEGSVVLPEDKSSYSTYASDGTTVVKERCSFEGPIQINGSDCTWSAVLSYDYKTQIVTGNLNDTVRIIYAYATMNVEPEPAEEPAPEA